MKETCYRAYTKRRLSENTRLPHPLRQSLYINYCITSQGICQYIFRKNRNFVDFVKVFVIISRAITANCHIKAMLNSKTRLKEIFFFETGEILYTRGTTQIASEDAAFGD